MNEEERWKHLVDLDEELLKGGVVLSEWCNFLVREADTAFARGAFLAAILTAVCGIETYLRSEYGNNGQESLYDLINGASIEDDLKKDLQKLRTYRNKWVHVNDPWSDEKLIESPEKFEKELEEIAFFAARALRRTIYENQWI